MREKLETEELKLEVKNLILDALKIKNIKANDILDDVPLLSGKNVFVIDSIDIIEILMALQKKYDVRIDDQNHARTVLVSVNSIVEFLEKEKKY